MRIQALATAAVLALTAAACSEQKSAPAAAETAAPVLTGRAAVYAAGARVSEPKDTPDPAEATITPGRDPLYSRTMNALIGVDDREAKRKKTAPRLDYDPICACQDADAFALKSVTMTPESPQAATAEVVFANAGQDHRQTLKLLKEGPMWRIADVIDDKGKSLHDDLMAIAEKAPG